MGCCKFEKEIKKFCEITNDPLSTLVIMYKIIKSQNLNTNWKPILSETLKDYIHSLGVIYVDESKENETKQEQMIPPLIQLHDKTLKIVKNQLGSDQIFH